jgi:hypothetical protein
MTQIHELTVIELAAAIRGRELSPVAVTDHYLRRTTGLNDQVGAFYTITAELAAEQAVAAEKALAREADPACLPPLTGVPIPIKDLNMVAGVRQTFGSHPLFLLPNGPRCPPPSSRQQHVLDADDRGRPVDLSGERLPAGTAGCARRAVA